MVSLKLIPFSFIFFSFILLSDLSFGQVPDTSYSYPILSPAYSNSNRPLILIDGAHNNLHTAYGRYRPLKKLLESDGYRVEGFFEKLTKKSLANCRIFITSNALHKSNVKKWVLPTPSAYSEEEIKLLKEWVRQGGRLFIITDHMPCAGAVENLGKAFGFEFSNGFVTGPGVGDYLQFTSREGGLIVNSITKGRNDTEKIDSVATFSGSAFKIPEEAESILTFKGSFISMTPDTAWRFSSTTPRVSIDGWSQGAVLKHGKGRVALFGEAAMFTAQLGGPEKNKVGFNSIHAPQNAQFTLNVIHWLDELLK